MVKWLLPGLLLLAARQDPKNPDLHVNADYGFSVQKPAGADWTFETTGGRLRQSRLLVRHKSDPISVEVAVYLPVSNSYDPKRAAEEEYTEQAASDVHKEVRKRKLEDATLPGKAAGGARGWYLEMLLRDKADKFTEWRMWIFVGRENRCLYKICVTSPEGAYEKHRKEIESILSSLKTARLARK